jgi:glutathione synthase/RimK-type ligase-like ATP-grasp enzyme
VTGTAVLVGHSQDEHCDIIEGILRQRDAVRVVRVSLDMYPAAPTTWSALSGWNINGETVMDGPISGLYRRPGVAEVTAYQPKYAAFADSECRDAFHGVLSALNISWLNQPSALADAELKVRQLTAAEHLGIRTPPTLVTNVSSHAEDFCAVHKRVVAKPIRYGLVASEPDAVVAWVTEVSPQDLRALEGPPIILQKLISARVHLRAVTVGDGCFVCALPAHGAVDWRQCIDNHSRFHVADSAVADRLTPLALQMASELKLSYSSQDWILDAGNDLNFLEANPNGQWAFLDCLFEPSISEVVADYLVHLAQP